ncbi:hypothetical protein BIV25_11025 [Streptomyces sp. MUSC 14]|uniref:hypothetical protein n=1 Tax=Streptomyces sp. MUSC 14 TaxID=1354889 RepID=UPI0008F5AFFB|nr:hypothetical protein [Streptomyces sp. MUSC 14]OIJ99029.1 hypothetical protein BIV25_11025 [Streptomyces sp. MUSC 14]
MTNPHPDQSARADRRTLPYPGDEAITAARHRAHQAFAQLFTALGAGRHRLTYAALDVDGRYALASATVDVTTAPAWHLDADPDEFAAIEAAVTAALEGSCTVLATLIVQTDQEPSPTVCGWRIERGWLHGMNPVTVYAAVRPCANSSTPIASVYPAPSLPDPSVTG